ncbi:MAG TPA: DUF4351 domain-containing protein [Telluria sp.]|nr:DUF4351 domain-containing protein [Telluria sp.]
MDENPNDDYDSPWKDAVTRYFPEFMAFYFPEAHAQIDWLKPYDFLEQELAQVTHDAQLGCRRVDKLVRVARRGGGEGWVFIHVDVQAQYDRDFAERIFTYNYRIYDRYRRPVASLAVLADGRASWRPGSFSYPVLGCEMGITFPLAKLTDYAGKVEQLLADQNPFGLVTAAHLLTQQTRHQNVKRHDAKWRLARLLYERDWDKQRIVDLFAIIDWMMNLPSELQHQLLTNIVQLERERKMPYLNSFERLGLEKGRAEGREEGREEGRKQALSELISVQLTERFGELPERVRGRIEQATPSDLFAWGKAVLDAPTLDSIFERR